MQERNVDDDHSMNFAVRRKADSLHSAEILRRVERLNEAGALEANSRSLLKYRIVCQERAAVQEALDCLEAGNTARFSEIVEETKEREASFAQSRRLRIQKNLASKAARSDAGRAVVNSTIGETGAPILDVCLQVLHHVQSAEQYAETEVLIYTVITKTAALQNAECITETERRTLISYGLTFCSILIDQCELGSILPYAPEELVETLYCFFSMLESVVEPFVKEDTLGKYMSVRNSLCSPVFFDQLLRSDGCRPQRDQIAASLRLLRQEIGNF
jgi:hypothetical protein